MAEMENKSGVKERVFRPTVLVAAEEDARGSALMDEAQLEGLIMQKCSENDIYHSNVLMVATNAASEEPTVKYHKVQDKAFFKAFSVICQKEEFCNDSICKKNDAIAAEFLLEQEIKEQMSYKGLLAIKVIEDSEHKRKGIRYICPHTCLDEFAFPVRLYGKPMGVLIVGQISTEEHQKYLEHFIMDKYGKPLEEEPVKSIIQKLSDRLETDIQELIDKISKAVGDIENGLIDYYEERQNKYILEQSGELIEAFKEARTKEEKDASSSELVYPAAQYRKHYNYIGQCIAEQLEQFCDTVNVKHRRIFVPSFENLANNQYNQIENEGFTFYYDRWKGSDQQKQVSDAPEQYIDHLEDAYDMLFVADSSTYPIVLTVGSNELLMNIKGKERELLQRTFGDTFYKFAEYAQMAGMEAKSEYYRVYLDNYMSIQRHELGQSNLGHRMLIEEFKKCRKSFKKEISNDGLDRKTSEAIEKYLKQCDDFVDDSEKHLYSTMIRIQSTKYLIDFSKPEKEYFWPYESFLFKWKQIYELKAYKENLQFTFPQVVSSDVNRPQMYGDPQMIEQAVYNLTNNAMKYAIRGTEVSLDIQLNNSLNRYEIIVKNIGGKITEEEKERIFYFGQRGSNNQKEGSGLGLFLTKQIALAHGGEVECEVEELSEYNWPLIPLYLEYYQNKDIKGLCKDDVLYQRLQNEWKEKEQEIRKYTVREIPNTAFTPMYVHQNIRKEIARFKFTFWIPLKGTSTGGE